VEVHQQMRNSLLSRRGGIPQNHRRVICGGRERCITTSHGKSGPAAESFFPEKGGSSREAKRICADCPVRIECLNYALRRDERYGVWGGMSERERRRLKRMAS
jgi:hypothetical protein